MRRGFSLWIVVSKNTGVLNVVAAEDVARNVLGEGLQSGVGVDGFTIVPLCHWSIHLSACYETGWLHDLVHGKETVNVDVMEPEDGIKSSIVEQTHVTTTITNGSVDKIVHRLDAVCVAIGLLDTNCFGASVTPRCTAGENVVNTLAKA